MDSEFTPSSLEKAVRSLFVLNNYEVDGPLKLHGASVDLRARTKADPFAPNIYIEVTVEHVNHDKYGADLTKLALIREKEPDAQLLIVSARGFTQDVVERAEATRVRVLTYDKLFRTFVRFEPYIAAVTGEGETADQLRLLDGRYEEPLFDDKLGKVQATEFLTRWLRETDERRRWLIVVGDYGTGKTALTKVLQYRWLQAYQRDPSLPLPLRIELRDFGKQFDARGLLHHFLDTAGLGHLPIEFVFSLIKDGRVVLLLDGYDEMAQYMNVRERRTCLEALATLSVDGAKGVLTSRPNYFSETEELQVFEILYAAVGLDPEWLTAGERDSLRREREIDQLLDAQFFNRYERVLRDLSVEQTERLVQRALSGDQAGQEIVLRILRRVFRVGDEGGSTALSGKPAIISYLLQVVDTLKERGLEDEDSLLSEWRIYNLIVKHLMLRDYRRSPELSPDRRRSFLRELSHSLSRRDSPVIAESEFRDLIRKFFRAELMSRLPEEIEPAVERFFADLRGSATLTRSEDARRSGWRFSHNSLREFLLVEHMLDGLREGRGLPDVRTTDLMRQFVSSRAEADVKATTKLLAEHWRDRRQIAGIGGVLTLLWDGLLKVCSGEKDAVRTALSLATSGEFRLNGTTLRDMRLAVGDGGSDLPGLDCHDCEISRVAFTNSNLSGADFRECQCEEVSFDGCDLSKSLFAGALLVDVSMREATLDSADFRGIDNDSRVVVQLPSGVTAPLSGQELVGFLRYRGALTDPVGSFLVLRWHPRFSVVEKICRKLAEQGKRQRRGLEQRGAARADTEYASAFVEHLLHQGLVEAERGGEIVRPTELGRKAFGAFVEQRDVAGPIAAFLAQQ